MIGTLEEIGMWGSKDNQLKVSQDIRQKSIGHQMVALLNDI